MSDQAPYWQAEARFDWARYVSDHGGVRAIRSKSSEYMLTCPDCGKLKLAVNAHKRAWRCFTCGDAGRDASSLIAKVESLPWKDAIVSVITGPGMRIGRVDRIEAELNKEASRPTPQVWHEIGMPEGFVSLTFEPTIWPSFGVPTKDAILRGITYCQRRGIPDYVQRAMRLGVCTCGPFKDRLVFPIWDSGGRTIFYQGRAMWNKRPDRRYIKTLSPRLQEGSAGAADVVLNLEFVKSHAMTSVLLVEGPIDCAHAWPDAVATLGKHLSYEQIRLLVRAGIRQLDLCWDADAIAEMMATAPVLADLFDVRIVELPPGTDPGDLTKEQIEYHRCQAMPWSGGGRLSQLPEL